VLVSPEGVCWESEWLILRHLPESLSGETSEWGGACASIRRVVEASLVGDEAWSYMARSIG
jgi:hypothetical protein